VPVPDAPAAGLLRVHEVRSTLPAVTHVDGSARLQTVDSTRNPPLERLLRAFYERTGCPVLINTSFNVRGEPIVCTPEDAYRCFMATNMDVLVIENFVLVKDSQPQATSHSIDEHLARFDPDRGYLRMHSPQLSDRQLRYFGASLAALLVALAALAHWKWQSPITGGVLLACAVVLFVVYYAVAATRRPIYRAFRAFTYPIQWFMTAVILAIVYFGIITPIGLMLRLRGIGIRTTGQAKQSYWVARQDSSEPSSYFHTY